MSEFAGCHRVRGDSTALSSDEPRSHVYVATGCDVRRVQVLGQQAFRACHLGGIPRKGGHQEFFRLNDSSESIINVGDGAFLLLEESCFENNRQGATGLVSEASSAEATTLCGILVQFSRDRWRL